MWEGAPPGAVSPPIIDPARWEDYPAFRETFLRWFTEPAYNATLRGLGELLHTMVLEFSGYMPDEPDGYVRHDLRAAVADLRHLQGFLGSPATTTLVDLDPDEPANADSIRLCRLAVRLAPRVGRIADAIEGALQ